jgi:hypothetical protein
LRACLSVYFIKKKRITTTQLQENSRNAKLKNYKKQHIEKNHIITLHQNNLKRLKPAEIEETMDNRKGCLTNETSRRNDVEVMKDDVFKKGRDFEHWRSQSSASLGRGPPLPFANFYRYNKYEQI